MNRPTLPTPPGCDGRIEQPRPGAPVPREAFVVSGWALLAREALSHIDVLLDGEVAGRARIGLARPDIRAAAELGKSVGAGVCGFEWWSDPSLLALDADRVLVGARVTGTNGETFELSMRDAVEIEAPPPPDEGAHDYAARRRARTQEIVPGGRREPKGNRTRLVAFTHRLDHGGAQRYFFEQIRYLMRDPDVSCTVVAPADGPWRRRLETIGADVHLTAYPVEGPAEYESAIAQLAAWANHHAFDAVLVNTLDAFIGADMADRLGLPVAWSIHESFPVPIWWRVAHSSRGHRYVRARLEQALGRASALIFAADATKDLYTPYASPERMVSAPYGLELSDIDLFRQRLDSERLARRRSVFPDDASVLLCLGTVTARKAQAVLVQAFSEIAADHPRAHLVMVGDQGGKYSAAIDDYAAQAGLASRVSLVPVTSDAYGWHEMADLFVLSSDIESSPISILEAMAFETPVVASNVFGVPELIEDGRHGYLCEPNNVGDLASALDRALKADPTQHAEVTAAAAARLRDRHDPDRYARCLLSLLEDLIQDPGAKPTWDTPFEFDRSSAGGGAGVVERVAEPSLNRGSPQSPPSPRAAHSTPARWKGEGEAEVRPTVRDELEAVIRSRASRLMGPEAVDALLEDGPPSDERLRQHLALVARIQPSGRSVLVVGSGFGELARRMRSLGAELVDGLEADPDRCMLARLLSSYHRCSRISFENADVVAGAPASDYDLVVHLASPSPPGLGQAGALARRAMVIETADGDFETAVPAEVLSAFPFPVALTDGEAQDKATVVWLAARDETTADELLREQPSRHAAR